jgi:protein O-mannosyl-transferase
MARQEKSKHHQALREARPSWWQRPALLIFLAAILINANTLNHSWALDDTLLITQNKLTQQGFAAIPEIWGSDVFTGYFGKGGIEQGGRYRPLSQTVFAACHGLLGPSPFTGHLLNVVLYGLTCVLLFVLLRRIFPERAGTSLWTNIPLIATLLFALHPLHVEVVANIKSLDEILAMGFALLTVWFALRVEDGKRSRNMVLSGTCFFLALAAKENAITFLAVVPLVLFYTGAPRNAILRSCLLLLVPAVLYFLLRASALGPTQAIAPVDNYLTNPFFGATGVERIATVLLTWWKYIGLLLFPHPLTSDHYPGMIPVIGWNDLRAWASALIFVGAGVFALLNLRKRNVVAFGIAFFLITFSVVSNLVINLGTPLNDRFLFMPLAGFTLVLAWALVIGIERLRWPQAATMGKVMLGLVLLAYAGKTFSRNRDWKDDLTLFTHDVQVSDKSARCQIMTAKLLYDAATDIADTSLRTSYLNRAKDHLHRGLAIYPDYSLAWGLLGLMEMDAKHYRSAADLYIQCLRIEPTEEVALINLNFVGRRLFEAKDHEGAELALQALKHFDPARPDPYLLLADMRMRTGRADSSIVLLDALLVLDPKNADAYRMKGEILAVYRNDPAEAEANFLKAYALDPANASLAENLGIAAFQRNDAAQALTYFLKAVDLRPRDPRPLTLVAEAYRALGDPVKAEGYRERARQVTAGTADAAR